MVWVNALIESAGTDILSGPETVDLEAEADRRSAGGDGQAGQLLGRAAELSTSNEDTARLGFEAGESAFMINYTFAYAERQGRSAGHLQEMGFAPLPAGRREQAEQTAAGRLQPRGQLLLEEQGRRLRRRHLPGRRKSQLTAVELDGLPPSRSDLYADKVVTKAYPGFADLIKESIEAAGPRPTDARLPGRLLGDPAHPAPAGQDRPRRHRTRSTTN